MRRLICSLLIIVLTMSIMTACQNDKKDEIATKKKEAKEVILKDCALERDNEFGGIFIKITIEDFNKLGFEYGDSLDLDFSNGYKEKDLPYYSGYYVEAGNKLVVAYPGYPYIRVGINYGDDLYKIAKVNDKDTVTVEVAERGKYSEVQKVMDMHYTDIPSDYESDIVFANFRYSVGGDMKKEMLYRSASPCDNQHQRASYADALAKKAGVNFVLNLSDNDEDIKGYFKEKEFDSSYYKKLHKDGKVCAIDLDANYKSDDFKKKLAKGLTEMSKSEGPYLIHCVEGKDRTGIVCLLLEALVGASYQEILDDYMITYDNYFGVNKESNNDTYNSIITIHLNTMLRYITGEKEDEKLIEANLEESAREYLKGGGMSEKDIDNLVDKLKEE